ncbi:hypothetical protein D3C75_1105520 [compost metagenome]
MTWQRSMWASSSKVRMQTTPSMRMAWLTPAGIHKACPPGITQLPPSLLTRITPLAA